MSRRMSACFLLLLAAGLASPARADDVRRCVDAQGVAVYTDRPCESVQAVPRGVDPSIPAGAYLAEGFAVRGCARRPEQLLDGVRGALEARDVNRLANWYHWTGTGTGTARHLMDELEAIARRSVVAIELVYPDGPPGTGPALPAGEAAASALPSPGGNGVRFTSTPAPADGTSSGEVNPTPFLASAGTSPVLTDPPDPGPEPDGLRVMQTRAPDDIAAVATQFRLVRNAGCWWVEL